MKLLHITDNGGETMDRYTAYFDCGLHLMMSPAPLSPQGVCLSDENVRYQIESDRGKKILFSQCPEQVQTVIARFLVEVAE